MLDIVFVFDIIVLSLGGVSVYFVYEVFPDGAKYFVFSSVDGFDCILYKHNHMFDNKLSYFVID